MISLLGTYGAFFSFLGEVSLSKIILLLMVSLLQHNKEDTICNRLDCPPVKVHGVGRVVLVGLVPVEALRHSVGGQQVGAGQGRHLRHLGLHAGVKVLEKHVVMRL